MSQCLQEDVEVSKNTLLVILQLLVKDGDPQLVLELFNLYNNNLKAKNIKVVSNNTHSKNNHNEYDDNDYDVEKKSKKDEKSVFSCNSYSSAIYNPVLHSLGLQFFLAIII